PLPRLRVAQDGRRRVPSLQGEEVTTRTWRPVPADERAAIVATYVAGQTIAETAATHGVGRNTVWRIIDAAGVSRKRGPGRTRPRKVAPPCQHGPCRN